MEGITEIFDTANSIGINVVTAAGNDYTSAYGNRWDNDLQYGYNPDNVILSYPPHLRATSPSLP